MTDAVLDRKSRAAVLLARGWSTDRVGTDVGVTARTVRRWLTDPEFSDRVHDIRRTTLAETVSALELTARAAVNVLGEALLSEQPMPLRVRAALGVLNALPNIAAYAELDERLAALEATADCRRTS